MRRLKAQQGEQREDNLVFHPTEQDSQRAHYVSTKTLISSTKRMPLQANMKKALRDARPLVAGGGLEPPTSGL